MYTNGYPSRRKDIANIKQKLRKQYESGNRNREEALNLLAACLGNEGETAPDFAYRISELVRLAYPEFSDAYRNLHEKDVFVRGLHPEMQIKLKALETFSTMDMTRLLEHTVRLEVAGVKTFSKKYKEYMNTVDECSTSDISKNKTSSEMLNRLNGLEVAMAKLTATDKYPSNQSFQPPALNTRRNTPFGNVGGNRKCWNCGDKSHFVRRCPNRFCQSCGKQGHDAWNKECHNNR